MSAAGIGIEIGDGAADGIAAETGMDGLKRVVRKRFVRLSRWRGILPFRTARKRLAKVCRERTAAGVGGDVADAAEAIADRVDCRGRMRRSRI